MKKLKAGKTLIEWVKLCYHADEPFLLIGGHGVGKSEMTEQAAKELGVGYVCRDLSLMEPPDLVGMPDKSGGQTHYFPPAFLPTEGKGILVFEELNRCPNYMRAPCLQLLTARTLNDYRLPPGWLPAAAVNPPDADYDVQELDPAHLSRFAKVRVVPDPKEWAAWAEANCVHPQVVSYVRGDAKVFTDTCPRDWYKASRLVRAAAKAKADASVLAAALAGVVGDDRARAFLNHIKHGPSVPDVDDLLADYKAHQAAVRKWLKEGQVDALDNLAHALKAALQVERTYEQVRKDRARWASLGAFLSDLPPDLAEDVRAFMEAQGYDTPTTKKASA